MVSNNFIAKFNFITNIVILSVMVFGGFVWADTNGVWVFAEDIRPGTFGADEGSGEYIFPTNVTTPIININDQICINGECYDDWDNICLSWLETNSIN